jgi:hypothetical protein
MALLLTNAHHSGRLSYACEECGKPACFHSVETHKAYQSEPLILAAGSSFGDGIYFAIESWQQVIL